MHRRFDFLNWAFDSSPKALGHVIAVVRCSSAIASSSPSSLSLTDDENVEPVQLPQFPDISKEHAWVFCFFKPGSVSGTFKCRLPHEKQHNISVLFCDGGLKMHDSLLHHLNTHGIKENYGKLNRDFTENGVTIHLTSVVNI